MESKPKYIRRALWKVTSLLNGDVYYTQDSAEIIQIENRLSVMTGDDTPVVKIEYITGGAEYILYAAKDSTE